MPQVHSIMCRKPKQKAHMVCKLLDILSMNTGLEEKDKLLAVIAMAHEEVVDVRAQIERRILGINSHGRWLTNELAQDHERRVCLEFYSEVNRCLIYETVSDSPAKASGSCTVDVDAEVDTEVNNAAVVRVAADGADWDDLSGDVERHGASDGQASWPSVRV